MRSRQLQACLAVAVLLFAFPAAAASREEQRVADSADVLDQLLRIPEQRIPPAMLARAYAVAVIPSVVRIGFGLGARRGKGILVVRQDDGSWSNPAFITLTGGSFGFQAGVQRTDVVLVFKTHRGVENIANGKLTLGADASIAAGPVGRSVEGATDIRFQAEIVSYSRARGIFAGVSFAGSGVTMDRKANAAFYSSPSMTPEQIFSSSPNIAPDAANRFVQVLTAQTTRLAQAPGMATSAASAPAAESESSVQTFGMPGPGESDDTIDSGESYYDPNL
ncbi:MAG: lipid-binding SYLF domain-containing protein [Gammaproteobacteria bacterium]|jgi:lipid-binding SYLF domain-containing protein|nr:lipid-binding SYLF domain-containing protein [Gammaproteobacteria bacterium]MDH3847917.1 lipid-binding SYLF domain-containing protein [Gammaproteobacteria bacterium]MDH3864012.1 lipid-binding SYLF domain-containing protein [Gammaproteobacteria bacterium]MDH3904902.1 lipid-binding SYLF domain-containing protein [Gammaproteobacteria bacterium]MDH3909217.1 lipid-binding SYLF domain-containing protein [Gammaproteobacteria bacterium]